MSIGTGGSRAPRLPKKRRHHYVPQWYLRRWSDAAGHIWWHTKGRPEGVSVPPRSVCFVDRLHEVVGRDRSPDEIEDALGTAVEGPASRALLALLDDARNADARRMFGRFILHLPNRHPSRLALVRNEAADYTEEFLKRLPATQAAAIADLLPASDLAVETVLRVDKVDVDRLVQWRWEFVHLGHGLVTTDRPLVEHAVGGELHGFSIAVDPSRLLIVRAASAGFADVPATALVGTHIVRSVEYASCVLAATKIGCGNWIGAGAIRYPVAIARLAASAEVATPFVDPIRWG